MLFWIFVILFVVSVIACCIGTANKYTSDDWGDVLQFCSGIMIFFMTAALMISGFTMISNYSNIDGKIAAYHSNYDILVWQFENNIYENDNDIGKKELMDDIRDWNYDLSLRKVKQRDFWVGIYYPDIYDQFELIELPWY